MSGHGHAKKEYKASTQDWGIMIITFVVGVVAGFYLYATAFAPQFDELLGQTEEVYEDFVLEGTQYGGDRMGGTAPSFQVLENGSYRYLPYAAEGEIAEAREGLIPRALLNEVQQTLTVEALEISSQIVTRGDCMSYVDGRDYSYEVTLDGVEYTLDTCTTALSSGSIINTTLDKLWNYFETLE
ncbi:hypothetical protein K2P47_01850 [Patescibacteria group bacterium]|nr:hypothetical protein [Patescibacteria group bacterium]